ncbi:MAG: 50S ribosomal protein L10 [Ignavibacteriaceae bacterium]|nr:50S ribosomal protein L10 [Ignavibacteriaceae bacterium]
MNRNEKTEVISEVKEMIENSTAIYLTDYSGVDVEDVNDLRNQFRKEGVRYKVFKNTLFKIALEESGKYDKLADHLIGMTSFAFASENPVAPAKIIKKYFDDKKKLSLKACYIEDEYFDGDQLKALASLPSKDELIAGIMASLDSPASGIVGSINAVMRDLLSVIDEVAKTKAS